MSPPTKPGMIQVVLNWFEELKQHVPFTKSRTLQPIPESPFSPWRVVPMGLTPVHALAFNSGGGNGL